MVKEEYSRYEFISQAGIICSPTARCVHFTVITTKDGTIRSLLATAALETVLIWDIRTQDLIVRLEQDVEQTEHSVVTDVRSVTSLNVFQSLESILIFVGYDDGSIRIWTSSLDQFEFSLTVVLTGHRGAVTVLQSNLDGSLLLSGGRDGDLVIWDIHSQTGLMRLKGHTQAITQVAFLEDSKLLISASKDGSLKVWELTSHLCILTCLEHQQCGGGAIMDFVLSPDQRTLLTTGEDNQIRIFAIDPSYLARISSDVNLVLNQLPNTKLEEEEKGCMNGTRELGLALVGQCQRFGKERSIQLKLINCQDESATAYLSVLTADRIIELFEIKSPDALKRRLKRRQKQDPEEGHLHPEDLLHSVQLLRLPHKGFSFDSFFSKTGELNLIVGLSENAIIEYTLSPSIEKNKKKQVLSQQDTMEVKERYLFSGRGHRGSIRALALNPNGDFLCSIGLEGVLVWSIDPESQHLTRMHSISLSIDSDSREEIGNAIAFIDATRIVVGCQSGRLLLVDTLSSSVQGVNNAVDDAEKPTPITHLYIRGQLLVSSQGSQVSFFEVKPATSERPVRLKALKTLQLSSETAGAVCLSPDLRLVAVALTDLTIKVFFVDTLKFFINLYGHKLPVTSIDIASDSQTLISGSADKSVKIWGLDFGDLRKSIYAHNDTVSDVKFINKFDAEEQHPLWFISAGRDGQVKFWNARTFEQLMRFPRSSPLCNTMVHLAVTRDMVIAAGIDLRLWSVNQDDPLFPQEERDRELAALLEQDLLQDDEDYLVGQNQNADDGTMIVDEAQLRPTRQTLTAIKASEKLIEALEIADEEVQRRELSASEDTAPLGHFKAFCQAFSKPFDKPLTEPCELVVTTIERMRLADLEECLMALPNRLLPSLMRHIRVCTETWKHMGTALYSLSRCLLLIIKIHYVELARDSEMKRDLAIIVPVVRAQLFTLRQQLQQQIVINSIIHQAPKSNINND